MTDADDYCFTNRAIIHVNGECAMSKKRLLRRYDYLMHNISNVFLETAGTIDLNVEIKFTIDNKPLSIDIHIGNDNVSPSASFEEITCFANNWMIDHKEKYKKGDFSHIFDLYMNN